MSLRLVARVRGAFQWMKAVDLSSHARYEEALRYAVRVEKATEAGFDGKPSKYNVYALILQGYILFHMTRYKDAVYALVKASEHMGPDENPSETSKYCQNYISHLGLASLAALGRLNGTELPAAFTVRHEDIDMRNVPRHIRSLFPMEDRRCDRGDGSPILLPQAVAEAKELSQRIGSPSSITKH